MIRQARIGIGPGLRSDGRPNHKPRAAYCPGVKPLSDDILWLIDNRRTHDDLQRLDNAIWAKAAEIREARRT